jgi:DNA-binding NtrC family response regulator
MADRAEPDGAPAPLSPPARVLVVDDDRAVRNVLQVNLTRHGMQVEIATDARQALVALHERAFDLVLTDVRMPGATGLELLARVRRSWPDVQVIVMTGYGSVEDAVAAMKAGAADYLIKPVARDELLVVLDRALEHRTLRAQLLQLRREVQDRYGFENLIGTSPVMISLYEEVAAVAETTATVLLQGPTGTGKELLARAVHYRSPRAAGPLVSVNCASIPETLLESELFGHEKGAFTGAVRQHRGRFEQADGGTLFLDEIGEISPAMQAKLLRVLQTGDIQRVGGQETVHIDVRVVAATNRDLAAEVQAGRFREDLFYRLNVVTVRVPSLAERREDIPLLVEHFVRRQAEKNERPIPHVTRTTLDVLSALDWPGNVRQLEHAVERAFILNRDPTRLEIQPPEGLAPRPPVIAPAGGALPPPGVTLHDVLEAHERELLVAALREARGVQATAARRLGLSKSNLCYRLKKLGIEIEDIRYR